jgi:hypothetical protein
MVVGFDAPYRTAQVTFPDGRVIRRTDENNPELGSGDEPITRVNRLLAAWTSDMTFVLDRLERLKTTDPGGKLTGRLDTTRVGAFGHSFGGAQSAQFCQQDSRCGAAIDVDGIPFGSVIQKGIPRPFMFIVSCDARCWQHDTDPESLRVKADIQSIYERLPAHDRFLLAIRGSNHFTFTDDGSVFKSHIMRGILRLFGKLKIDGRRQLALTAYSIHSSFDTYLKHSQATPLNLTSQLYPEIEILP